MPFLLLMSLALVLTWTFRLARAKARNPWVWGSAAVAPVVLWMATSESIWQLLSMLPMVVLLLLKAPRTQRGPGPTGITCSRCQASQPHGRYYCTNCGWELAKAYSDAVVLTAERASAGLSESLETASPTRATPAPDLLEIDRVQTDPVQADPVQPGPALAETPPAPGVQPQNEPLDQPQEPQPQGPSPAEEPPRVFRGLPTAEGLTERGVALYKERRVQESIDQFTKALALDSGYAPAWEARAEAYARLGREADAAEDRRRLKAINAS